MMAFPFLRQAEQTSIRLTIAKKAKSLADKFGFKFVPLQEKFDEVSKNTPTEWWLADGVHPAPAGHKLIADELIKALDL